MEAKRIGYTIPESFQNSFQVLQFKELYKKRLITYYFMPSIFGSSCIAKDTFKDYDWWWLTYSNCNAALRIPKWGFKQALSTTFGHGKLVSRACLGLHVECISISEESLHFRMSRTFFCRILSRVNNKIRKTLWIRLQCRCHVVIYHRTKLTVPISGSLVNFW